MPNMVELIKKAAVEAVSHSQPMAIVFGTVVSVEPLEINIEQKLTLDEDHLILTNNVRDYDVDMTVNHFTKEDAFLVTAHTHPAVGSGSFDSTHKHEYSGKKTFTIHNGLIVGDKVILLQMQGGQKYIVLEKVVEA